MPSRRSAFATAALAAAMPRQSSSFSVPTAFLSQRRQAARRDRHHRPFSLSPSSPTAAARDRDGTSGGSTILRVAANNPPPPSKIVDEDGPTPEKPPFEPPIVDSAAIEKLMEYDPDNHVVPHQPWRRGDTDGCEAPVDEQWRLEAEHIIETAAAGVGAYVEDVTWYLTFVSVTLSPDLSRVDLELGGAPPGPDVKVVTTSPKTNTFLEGPGMDDADDPAGFPVGSFAGEEHARIGSEWDDDDDDEDYEPQYDEATGEELPKPRRPTRAEAVYQYQQEKIFKREERGSRERWLNLPGLIQPHNVKDDIKDLYDGYLKDIDDFEALLVDKYGYEIGDGTEPFGHQSGDDEEEMTEQDLMGALKVLNVEWGLPPERLDEYLGWILEKYRLVWAYRGTNRKVNDMDVRGDGLTDDYAARLSRVGGAIKDALGEEGVDKRLDILDRHEVVLTSANFDSSVVETQRQFDANRGNDVLVQTQDPWNSNRELKGKLVDRNAMDVVLNQGGRMITVPNNMVAYVTLPEKNLKERAEIEHILATLDEAEAAAELAERKEAGMDAGMDDELEEGEYGYEEEEWDDEEEEYEYEEEEEEEEEFEGEVEEEWDEEEVEEEEVVEEVEDGGGEEGK